MQFLEDQKGQVGRCPPYHPAGFWDCCWLHIKHEGQSASHISGSTPKKSRTLCPFVPAHRVPLLCVSLSPSFPRPMTTWPPHSCPHTILPLSSTPQESSGHEPISQERHSDQLTQSGTPVVQSPVAGGQAHVASKHGFQSCPHLLQKAGSPGTEQRPQCAQDALQLSALIHRDPSHVHAEARQGLGICFLSPGTVPTSGVGLRPLGWGRDPAVRVKVWRGLQRPLI